LQFGFQARGRLATRRSSRRWYQGEANRLRSAPRQIGVNTASPAKCRSALLRKLSTEAVIASGERPH
jgi:nucleoside phosphorylase